MRGCVDAYLEVNFKYKYSLTDDRGPSRPAPAAARVAHGPWIHADIDTLNTNRTYSNTIYYPHPSRTVA